jgi:hypothetical protein
MGTNDWVTVLKKGNGLAVCSNRWANGRHGSASWNWDLQCSGLVSFHQIGCADMPVLPSCTGDGKCSFVRMFGLMCQVGG